MKYILFPSFYIFSKKVYYVEKIITSSPVSPIFFICILFAIFFILKIEKARGKLFQGILFSKKAIKRKYPKVFITS